MRLVPCPSRCPYRDPIPSAIAEDEFFAALLLESILENLGCDILGPLANLSEAIAAVREEDFDAAVLDINLNGQMVYPVADELLDLKIPFLFATGYAPSHLPERYRSLPQVRKPYTEVILTTAVQQLIETA